MRKSAWTRFGLLSIAVSLTVTSAGCATAGHFRVPPNTRLTVTDRVATQDASGTWTTSPFFWDSMGGARYQLVDTTSGKVVRAGKLKTNFRVVSIFWPPFAIIYWPVGFTKDEYDLTKPGDGYLVSDSQLAPGQTPTPARTKKRKN